MDPTASRSPPSPPSPPLHPTRPREGSPGQGVPVPPPRSRRQPSQMRLIHRGFYEADKRAAGMTSPGCSEYISSVTQSGFLADYRVRSPPATFFSASRRQSAAASEMAGMKGPPPPPQLH